MVVSDAPPLIRVLAASPRASIGVASGDSAYLLADVSGASLLDDGRIVIANCLPPLLRWYDTSGAYLMGAGREGEGPTEFPKGACARLFGISALTNGRVETWEHTHHRLRVFDSLGTQVSTRVLAAKSLAPGPEFLGKFERGYLMGEYPGRVHQHYFSGLDSWRDTLVMHAFGEHGDYEGIIGRTAGWPFTRTVLPTRFGPRGAVVLVPFAPLGMAAPWGPTVAVGDGSGPEVRVLDRGGKLTTIIRWKAERIAVTDSLIEILIDEAVSLETEGPSYKKTTREAFEAHPYPDTARSYSRLLVGRDGLLWVRQFSPPGATSATWLAFAASGSLVAAMDQPSGTTVLEIGDDYLLLLVENSLGVESVVLHDITELNPKRSDR